MFKQLFSSRKSSARRQTRRRLAFQQLETRRLLAVDIPWPVPPQPDPAAEEWIDLLAVEIASPAADESPAETQQGQGEGRPEQSDASRAIDLGDVVVIRSVESASPKLFEVASGGVGETEIKFVSQSRKPLESYIEIEFKDPLITNYSTQNSTEKPAEQLTFNYQKFEFQYKPSGDERPALDDAAQNNRDDDIILGANGTQPKGEVFVYYTPQASSSGNGSGSSSNAGGSTTQSGKPFGNSLLGPGGVVDRNGAAANADPNDAEAATELPDNAPVADNDQQPVPVIRVPWDVEPSDDIPSDIERAIRETSEELSRLQNQRPAPKLEDLPYISRLFRNQPPSEDAEFVSTFLMVTPRIIIQQSEDAGSAKSNDKVTASPNPAADKLIDAPSEDDKVEIDPLSLLEELRNAAEQELRELQEELQKESNREQLGSETIGDLTASGEELGRHLRQRRVESLRKRIAIIEADLEFLNDPKVTLWARN
jgi:type VI protein secretion system component Hcp